MHLEHKLTQRSTVAATVTSLNSQASTCASTKEAATRASSCIILRVSCYHHCTINLFGDQSERDNHPTIDSLTYGGNPMITSRHATHHHKNVSKHSLSKSRSDIGHRVIYLATLCNTMQHYHIATASAVYIISYKLNLESKIDNYSEDSNTWACSASTSASTEEASRRTRASTWRNATGIGSSRTLKQSDNHRRNTFLQSSAWPTCSTFSKHAMKSQVLPPPEPVPNRLPPELAPAIGGIWQTLASKHSHNRNAMSQGTLGTTAKYFARYFWFHLILIYFCRYLDQRQFAYTNWLQRWPKMNADITYILHT